MEKVKFEHFTLHSVRLLKDGGVSMRHEIQVPGDGIIDHIYGSEDLTIEPSEDFSKHFKDLKPTVAKVYKFDSYQTIVNSTQFKGTKDQKEQFDKQMEHILSKITIKSVSFKNWDSEDNKLVSIDAEFQDDYGHQLPIKTKDILLSKIQIGTEGDVQTACEQIIEEAFKYRYEGKRAELELPGFTAPREKKETSKDQEKKSGGKVRELKGKAEKVAATS